MEHLAKLLLAVKHDPKLFQNKQINYILGLANTQIKDLKKYATAENFITESKREFFVTLMGDKFIQDNPIVLWSDEINFKRPEVNLEYLKLNKAPPALTKAIRSLARHLLENKELKENSIEHSLIKELLCSASGCFKIKKEIEELILSSNKIQLTSIFEKFLNAPYSITKSIIAVLLLEILNKNKNVLAIYEKNQFQLKLDSLMFDRMICCTQNFEIKKTALDNNPLIEELSSIILPEKSSNILDLTKGLIQFIRNLDKYTLNTERLSKKTIRFRSTIINAKDPIALFERDFPRIFEQDDQVSGFRNSINELRVSYSNLIDEISSFLLNSFNEASKETLSKRFDTIKEYISNSELKILHNNIDNEAQNNTLWVERIATFINKSRVPKDWNDNDVADFKLKVKEFSQIFLAIEATTGEIIKLSPAATEILEKLLEFPRPERLGVLRKVVNE